jgi:hypothetical protein
VDVAPDVDRAGVLSLLGSAGDEGRLDCRSLTWRRTSYQRTDADSQAQAHGDQQATIGGNSPASDNSTGSYCRAEWQTSKQYECGLSRRTRSIGSDRRRCRSRRQLAILPRVGEETCDRSRTRCLRGSVASAASVAPVHGRSGCSGPGGPVSAGSGISFAAVPADSLQGRLRLHEAWEHIDDFRALPDRFSGPSRFDGTDRRR